MPPTDESLAAWLVLGSAPGVGPRTFARLVERFGDPRSVLGAPAHALAQCGLKPETVEAIKHPDRAAVDIALAWAQEPGAHILALGGTGYPPLLAEIPDAPPLLFVRGDPGLLSEPQLAIVGSRNATAGGLELTRDLAGQLAACGLVITSGLAIGVDGAAHAGALESGRTIAVLGTGPDRVYPAAHRDLARRIADTGALVSELPPGQGALAQNFPRRNRIISGLSLGTLVTEATLRSGSLITARHAAEQGREVFAVPGSVRNPLARGCHALIREGARLVESAAEILEELAPALRGALADEPPALVGSGPVPEGRPPTLDADYLRLLEAMGFDPVTPDELIRRTGLSAESVSSMLLLLELEGHVSSSPGSRYCRSTR